MAEHTKEPWAVEHGGVNYGSGLQIDEYFITNRSVCDDVAIASEIIDPLTSKPSEANARRIVACVNACAGISTENLEDNKPVVELARDYNLTIKQRDNAWLELRQIREAIKANPEESTFDEVSRVVNQRDILLGALKAYVLAVAVGGGSDKQQIMKAIRSADNDARAIIAGYEAF